MRHLHAFRATVARVLLALAVAAIGFSGLVCDAAFAQRAQSPAGVRRPVTPEERAYVIEQVRKRRGVEPDSDFSSMALYKDAKGIIHACGYVHARGRDGLFVYDGQRLFWGQFVLGKSADISGPVADGEKACSGRCAGSRASCSDVVGSTQGSATLTR